ncbi:MAG: cation-translocating P-type ATPase [bacterium]
MAASRSKPRVEIPEKPWVTSAEDVVRRLAVEPGDGLTTSQARGRRRRFGPNRLREAKREGAWAILVRQFKSLIIALLAVAAGLSFAFDELLEGAAILAVIAINAAIGFVTELRAVRAMEALRRLGQVKTKVRRNGRVREMAATTLVPGDIVVLEAGDIVSADLRLLESNRLQADESALTGESFPVGKTVEPLDEDAVLAERANMLFKGTAVTRGSGEGAVVATGMTTELGQVSALVEEAEDEVTPLEKRLDQLGHKLIWVTLAIAAIVAGTGILADKGVLLMVKTSIALAVAAIPEGLPIVATIALARGMWRMARRNAIVNRLSAVETLGSTSVICTDKTGTLTENRMTVTRIHVDGRETRVRGGDPATESPFSAHGQPIAPAEEPPLRELLEVSALCNNASLPREEDGDHKAVGEPLEVALLVAAAKAGIHREKLLERWPEVREEAFDPQVKMMATFHRDESDVRVAVKGAPEPVLEASCSVRTEEGSRELGDDERQEWLQLSTAMAEDGLRVLALAGKSAPDPEAEPYEGLALLGLVGMEDPPRPGVSRAVGSCRDAGIRVVMVTGDQAPTARSIGVAVGLLDDGDAAVVQGRELEDVEGADQTERTRLLEARLFARVAPKQKLSLIDLHQSNGAIVAMTGDGVNDAPALKKADIGVAMGQRGTQVAREAADMVLKDDAFGTIVSAVAQGRVIFANIRKFAYYLLSCNLSEILTVFVASVINAPLPILPLQILFLNLVTDVFPALALGVGEGDPDVMQRPPRDPQESILARRHWMGIVAFGWGITAAVLGALALALLWLRLPREQAVTVSFLTLAFAQLWHVFNMREPGSRLFRNDIARNPFVWGALALCAVMLLAATYTPALALVLKVAAPPLQGWLVILGMSLLPWAGGQIVLSARRAASP